MELNHHRGGAGEPLVLIHGIGSSWQAWLPVLPALQTRHDVIAVDLPGFGASPPLASGIPSTVSALTDAVESSLDAAELDRPRVAGNSLGGWIGLELARRGRVRSVVGLSPGGGWNSREAAYARAALAATYAGARRVRSYASALTRTGVGRAAIFSLVSSRPWRIAPDEARVALEAIGGADTFMETLDHSTSTHAEGLGEIDVPVTIAWGSRDRLLLPRQGPRFERAIPGARLRVLAGAGHVPMWDDPELVSRVILDVSAGG